MVETEHEKRVAAEALVADLENQIAELMLGMDDAEAARDVAVADGVVKDQALTDLIAAWNGGAVRMNMATMYAAIVAAEQALKDNPGAGLLAVATAAQEYADAVDEHFKGPEVHTAYVRLVEALDALGDA